MRKTSDIAMLLGSRSKSRSRGSKKSLFSSLVRVVDGLLGRTKSSRSKQRRASVSTLVFAGCLVAAFGGGFVIGERVGGGAGEDPLNARVAQRPEFVHEVDAAKLASEAFVAAAYLATETRSEEDAKESAVVLAKYLQANGLPKSRPYRWRAGLWVTVVYFEGDAERDHTRAMLLNMPDGEPDEEFSRSRLDSSWPPIHEIR